MSDKLDWDIALIGYDPTQRARYLDAIIDARQSGGPEPEMDCGRRKTDLVRLVDGHLEKIAASPDLCESDA